MVGHKKSLTSKMINTTSMSCIQFVIRLYNFYQIKVLSFYTSKPLKRKTEAKL